MEGWSFTSRDNFESRGELTLKMILDAIITHHAPIPAADIIVHTTDCPYAMLKGNYYYCCEDERELNHVIPDYTFSAWPEAGIDSYANITSQMIRAGEQPIQHNKIFWIGNVGTHPNREVLYNLSGGQYRHIFEVHHTMVNKHGSRGARYPYVTLPYHCKYKYLIDIEGRGYSGRLKYFLFSKRLLFIQERRYKEFFHFNLIPYVHFIPVKNDLSDLVDRYMEVKDNDSLYEQITTNAFQFALSQLNYQAVIKHLSTVLFTSM